MAKYIEVSKIYNAIVDDEDFNVVSQYQWYIFKTKRCLYAKTNVRNKDTNKRENLFMHRLVMNAQKGQKIDHINNIGLDNQKHNLRIASGAQNNANMRSFRGTSKYKGVHWDKDKNKWRVKVLRKHVGYFETEEAAANAYDNYAISLWGAFAKTNF